MESARQIGMVACMKPFVQRWKMNSENPKRGDIRVEVIDMETGEIRNYMCQDQRTASTLANTDYMAYGRAHSLIRIYMYLENGKYSEELAEKKEVAPWIKQDKTYKRGDLWTWHRLQNMQEYEMRKKGWA